MKQHTILSTTILTGAIMCLGGCNNKPTEQPQPNREQAVSQTITLPSGLMYEIITAAPADAQVAAKGHHVKVHYTGWLKDDKGMPGKKFDSSVDRGTPFEFPLAAGYVIRGWDEGVAGMKVGEKRRLFIPAQLGYGSRGAGAAIPPNSDLIFDVELIAIK